jgi:hypothetical protein
MTPVTHAALAGSCFSCLLRICHTARQSRPAKWAERGTGLRALAVAKSPSIRASNTGALRCTMRTRRAGAGSDACNCSRGITDEACQDGRPGTVLS